MQAMVESLLKQYSNILILRLRMPIVADLLYPRNFITKILRYDKVSSCCSLLHVIMGEAAVLRPRSRYRD